MIVLIPAHDEAPTLHATLLNLHAADPPPDSIIVIADHCTDSTAQVAASNGAIVFRREEGPSGKGQALRWLFETSPPALSPASVVVILDADSQVKPRFFSEIQEHFASGARAAQAFVQPVAMSSPAAALAAYSETLSQVVDDAARARLGWSVPLRGTGMACRADLLRDLLSHVHTRTEDIELSLLLADRDERVAWMPRAVVYDPKPPDAERVARQRARWLQGQARIWRDYWPLILRLLWRGPAMWWLIAALLLKPKTPFVLLKALVCLAALILPIPLWLKMPAALLVVAEAVYYGAGLWLVSPADRGRYACALLRAPLYLWVWARSALTACHSRSAWLSMRH